MTKISPCRILLSALLLFFALPCQARASEVAEFTGDFVRALAVAGHVQTRGLDIRADEPGDDQQWVDSQEDLEKVKGCLSRHAHEINPLIRDSVRGLLLACDVLSRNYGEIRELQKQIKTAREQQLPDNRLIELRKRRAELVQKAWELVSESASGVPQLLVRYPEGKRGELTVSAEEKESLLFQFDTLFPGANASASPGTVAASVQRIRQTLTQYPPSGESKPYGPER